MERAPWPRKFERAQRDGETAFRAMPACVSSRFYLSEEWLALAHL
jgi:hypothetical protein